MRKTVVGEVVKLIDTTEIKLSPYEAKKKKKDKNESVGRNK